LKIKDGFIIKQVVDSYVVVPVGENLVDFSAMISLNETGAFLWNNMEYDITVDELAEKLCAEYGIDKDTALADTEEFIARLETQDILEK